MAWRLFLDDDAKKELERLPTRDQAKIMQVLRLHTLDPFSGDIEKMKGQKNIWRRRVGAYRVFYQLWPDDKVIYVFAIKRRTSTTY